MMRFDKSTSFCASVPQLGDKNGNFDQKNDFSALDHFFCTLCSLFILDFIFFFFTSDARLRNFLLRWSKFKCRGSPAPDYLCGNADFFEIRYFLIWLAGP